MRERPILFSAPMVVAILAGTKRQTRRIVQSPARNMQRAGDQVISYRPPGDRWYGDHVWSMRDREGVWGDYTHAEFLAFCPYGAPGDRLWCKEGLRGDGQPGDRREGIVRYAADGEMVLVCATCGFVDCRCEGGPSCQMDLIWQWKRPTLPGMFCPRWASRLTLEMESVRIERLQDISEEDAKAEGCAGFDPEPRDEGGTIYAWKGRSSAPDPRAHFATLWDSINGDRPGASWAANPFCWAISFRRVEAGR